LAALALLLFSALGCQQKMALQPSYQPDDASDFFPDGKASRPPPAGTVARGHLSVDAALFTGRTSLEEPTTAPRQAREEQADRGGARPVLAGEAAQFEGVVDEFPFPITREILEHGRDRFMIYCVVCHDAAGTGYGKIVERGYTRPPSYHIDRLRQAPVGHIFRVISQGYGSMPSYAAQIPTRDRWAIVAYVRALQLSQHFPVEKLPDDMRQEWNESQKRDYGRRCDRSPTAESVAQRSPGLADRVGQPWVRATSSKPTLKGLCRAFDDTSTPFAIGGLHNPFSVAAPHHVLTQGWPPSVGQPWAVLHNPYGVSSQ
jgi:mono/diheme cytochrome c family protein